MPLIPKDIPALFYGSFPAAPKHPGGAGNVARRLVGPLQRDPGTRRPELDPRGARAVAPSASRSDRLPPTANLGLRARNLNDDAATCDMKVAIMRPSATAVKVPLEATLLGYMKII
jgi:hypothetical protein